MRLSGASRVQIPPSPLDKPKPAPEAGFVVVAIECSFPPFALRLVGFVDAAEAVAVRVNEDDEIVARAEVEARFRL